MTTSPAKLIRTALSLALVFPLLNTSRVLIAQTQTAAPTPNPSSTASLSSSEQPLRFEVASIRPHLSVGNEPSNRQMLPGGRFLATATTVRTLIRIAFGTEDNLISGAPEWIGSETFDINAVVANRTEVKSPQQFQQLLLSLLEDRFQFKFHREQREAPVFWLEVNKPGKLGPALKPSASDTQPNISSNSNGTTTRMKAAKISMSDFAAALRRQAERPVEDHTDLKGSFDFQIEWAPEEAVDSNVPNLLTVLKDQLGLKLRPAKGVIETVVIDQVAHPTPN